jgi:hypothetical protein
VVIAMVRNPRAWRTGSVENGKKNQDLFNDRIQPDRFMRKRTMIPDRGSETAARSHQHTCKKYGPTRKGEKNKANRGQNMNR